MSFHASARAACTASSSTHPSLLIIDDKEPVLAVIGKVAQKAGYDVMTCSSRGDALRMLARKPVDLAIVDLRMPDVNGFDLLRDIRRAVPECEVILMTDLTKPFDFDRLRKALADIRGELTAAAALPPPSLRDVERGHIVDVLRRVDGNRMAAAKVLGISRRALYRRLDRHHITDLIEQPQ
jgi:DNA-binding NtrC family response regulator